MWVLQGQAAAGALMVLAPDHLTSPFLSHAGEKITSRNGPQSPHHSRARANNVICRKIGHLSKAHAILMLVSKRHQNAVTQQSWDLSGVTTLFGDKLFNLNNDHNPVCDVIILLGLFWGKNIKISGDFRLPTYREI